ncbi:YceI family protein [Kordia sp.]|uniref:YceI family protein n=1 Tax=Kordia sp. TaxID=1965332 RepID=UPI003D6C5F3B
MKNIGLLLMLFITSYASAQKYFSKTGETEFKASVEAFEPVEAINKSTTVLLNTKNGTIAALLFVKAFHFEIALMEEHFNENYMDSDKFPKAVFKGEIIDFDMTSLSEIKKEFKLKGKLTVRGKTKNIETVVYLKKATNKILLTSKFNVSPQDFDIEIPSIVRNKIANAIQLKLNYELIEKK